MIPLVFALLLCWKDNSQVEDGYYILKQVKPAKSFTLVKTLPPNSTCWLDTTVKKNQQVCYMSVVYKDQERGYSNVDCEKNAR